MPPTLRFDVALTPSPRSTLSFTNSGAVDGDLVVAAIVRTNVTATPPAGWTQIEDTLVSNASSRLTTYARIASGEPASWDFTLASSITCAGWVGVYSGISSATPDAIAEVDGPPNNSSLIATGVTTTAANALLVGIWFWSGGRTITGTPAGMTVEHSNNGGPGMVAADVVQASAGASGDKTVTISSATAWGAQLVAFPAAAAGGAALSATVTGDSAAAATRLQVGHALSGAAAGGSQAAASSLVVGHALTASAAGASTAGATALAVGHALTAAVQGGSGGTANLTTQGGAAQLVADIAGGSALTASRLSLAHPLTAAVSGGSAAAATRLTVGHALAGAAAGASEATASRLTVGHTLAAGINGTSEVTATLGEAQLFYGIFAGRAALAPAWFPLIDWPERTRALAVAAFDGQVAAD